MNINGKFNKRYLLIAVYAFLTVSACVLFYLLFQNFEGVRNAVFGFLKIFTPIIYGFVIAYIINPIVKFFERILRKNDKLKFKSDASLRKAAMLLAYLLAAAFIGVFVLIITPNLTASVNLLIRNISRYTANLNSFIQSITEQAKKYTEDITFLSEQLENLANSFEDIISYVVNWAKGLFPEALNIVAKLSTGILNVFVGVIASMYMISGKEKFIAQLKKVMYAFLKREHVNNTIDFFRNVHKVIGDYIGGVLIDSCIVGIVTFIFLSMFGISFPLLISVVVAVTNVIPFFGPFIGAVPSGFILLMIEPMQAFIFAGIILLIQQIDGNIIAPRIHGETTGIPSLWVIVAILVGSDLFGFWGMLLGVPVFAVFYKGISAIVERRLMQKDMSPDTSEYLAGTYEEPRALIVEKSRSDEEKKPKKLIEKIYYFLKDKLIWLFKKLVWLLKMLKEILEKLFRWLKKKIGARNDKRKKWK